MVFRRIPFSRHFNNRTYCFVLKVIMLGSLSFYVVLYVFASVAAISKRTSFTPAPEDDIDREYWTWSWGCQDGNCIRMLNGNVSESSSFTSVGECRLVCSQYSTVWPQPTGKFKISRETLTVDLDKFTFNTDGVRGGKRAQEFLSLNSNNLFVKNLCSFCPRHADTQTGPRPEPKAVTEQVVSRDSGLPVAVTFITMATNDMILNWDTDESYLLIINSTLSAIEVYIKAETVFGARHALETLSQLIACKQGESLNSLVMMSGAKITDRPTYPHRGLLLDTARNFLPVNAILRTLNGMAASKLNIFHWHATDSHSFPLYSPSVPNLSRYGAYSSKEIYMPEDVKAIKEFAFLRGIRIVLEIDAPAHAGNGWQWGEKEGFGKLAVCVGEEPWRDYCIQPPCGQLNPTNPRVYTVLKRLYRDIQDQFDPEAFHMGGDEIYFPCWLSVSEIVNWMKSHGLNLTDSGLLELWSRFQAQSLDAWDQVATHHDTPIILWSSQLTDPQHIDKYLNSDRYVIELWTDKNDETPLQLLLKGYNIIMATKDAWYLDHGFWGTTTYHKWNDVYDNRIVEARLGVYGGEACLWGELVSDSNIDVKLWPRAACVAERLWADPGTSAEAALPRLLEHTDRLISLGIAPDIITPEWCQQNDDKCS